MSIQEHKNGCKAGDKRKKCRKKKIYSVFPILYPGTMGTPRSYKHGDHEGGHGGRGGGGNHNGGGHHSGGGTSGGTSGGGTSGGSPGGMTAGVESPRPSRARVFHELKRSFGLVEYFAGKLHAGNPNPAWGGYSVPHPGMLKMRHGGPTIGGPGFQYNIDGEEDGKGGKYNLKKSPGLGFRTESAWRVWERALELMDKNPAMPSQSILFRAMATAGVHKGQIDPAELRLVEMGIEWYLSGQSSPRSPGARTERPGYQGTGAP